MPELTTLLAFVGTALLLMLIPGPAVIYVITRSIQQGRKAGLVSVLGVGLGDAVNAVITALGLGALLASSSLVFSIIKYIGAAYLVYLGLRTIFGHSELNPSVETSTKKLSRIFRDAFVVEVLNPKTALFFVAFLPQFVNPKADDLSLQILFLGILFSLLGMVICSGYSLIAGSLGSFLKRSQRALNVTKYITGSIYICLGIVTALSDTGKGSKEAGSLAPRLS